MLSPDAGKEVIKKELPLIPKLPGVYRMLNSKNEILYNSKPLGDGLKIDNLLDKIIQRRIIKKHQI